MTERPNNFKNCRRYYKNHRTECIERSKQYIKKNRKRVTEQQKVRRKNRKILVFSHYGNKCECCGESHFEFLTLDHINAGGTQHRIKVSKGRGGEPFYRWIVKNNFPEGFQTLCLNCNTSLGLYGYCPHNSS